MINDIVNTVNQYEKLITLIFTFFVTMSTVVYALLTRKLTTETIKMRKAQTDPKLTVYLKHNDAGIHFLNFVVENIGTGQAYDVKMTVIKEPELKKKNGNMLKELGIIQHGLKHIAPRQKIETWYMSFIGIYEQVINDSIEISIEYKNDSKENISEYFIINFSQFGNINQLGGNPIQKIAQNMEKIERNISKITSGWNRIKVDVYDTEDRERSQKELEQRFNNNDESVVKIKDE